MKKEQAEQIAAKFIEALSQGVVPWRKPWSPAGTQLHNYFSKRRYRGINTLILGLQQMTHGYTSPAWTTYKAAAERDAYVRKGEKGTQIVFWKPIKITDKATGEEKMTLVARLYTVFNTDQIDGLDWTPPVATDPISVPDALASIYDNYPNRPDLQHVAQDRAYYSPAKDHIRLPLLTQFATVEDYAETYLHELVHSTGHPSRLHRFEADGNGCQKDYAKEELVAEIGASMLMQEAGINVDMPQHAAYVASWLKALENDHSLIVKAAQRAQKAVDHILATTVAAEESEKQEVAV